MRIVHSVDTWLSTTAVWLYDQITNLPDDIQCSVVASACMNLDQFPFEDLRSPDKPRTIYKLLADRSYTFAQKLRDYYLRRDLTAAQGNGILHSHFGDRAWSDIGASKRADLPHVVTFYGYDGSRLPQIEPAWNARFEELFAHANQVLVEGPFFGKTLQALGCPPEKLKVQHLGVRTEQIEFKARQHPSDGALRVLIVGSFVEKKGIPDAILALAALKNDIDLKITLVGDEIGQVRSIEEKQMIMSLLNQTGLLEKTRLVGFKPYADLLTLSYEHDLFLSPSRTASDGDSEGGAPVTLIAMSATGLPIVSTKHCDIPEVVVDGGSGLLAEERDVDGIAGAIRRLAEDSTLYENCSLAGRQHIEREFDSVMQSQRLAAIYRRIAN